MVDRPFINTPSAGVNVDLPRDGGSKVRWASGPAALIALIQVLRRSRPHELILDGRHRRLRLYFAADRARPADRAARQLPG